VEIILLERVAKVGNLGQRLNVKPGFARNYLIPTGKALPATAANVARFEVRKAELEKAAEQRLQEAQSRAAKLEGATITIAAQSGEEGRLFGSVGVHEIVKGLKAQGYDVARNEVRLPQGPIRMIGEHEVELQLQGGDFSTKLLVSIVPI
jgi:large subunit ribosomal protein L9